MKKFRKSLIMCLVVAAMVAVPFGQTTLAQFRPDAQEPSAGAMMVDVVPVRVLSFCGMVFGAVFFAVTLPVSYIAGNHEQAHEKWFSNQPATPSRDPWESSAKPDRFNQPREIRF